MSQFYTRAQIDAQGAHMATAINNKIKSALLTMPIPIPSASKFLGTFLTVESIPAYDSRTFAPEAGSYVYVDAGADKPTELYLWDEDALAFVKSNINPEVVANPPIEEAADITSFTTAFDEALAFDLAFEDQTS